MSDVMASSRSIQAVRRAIANVREDFARAYGWTRIEVTAHVDAEACSVRLEGEILVPRVRSRLATAVRRAVPRGYKVETSGLVSPAGGPWHALRPGRTMLWRQRPRTGVALELATDLLEDDGPVELLAVVDGAHLVRGTDGTLGWIEGQLGERTEPPCMAPPLGAGPGAVVDCARHRIGTAYLLGGTTERGIDCSGLVWRCIRGCTGLVLPRHSTDQLAIGPHVGVGADRPSTLVFVWSATEAPGHVGLASGEGTIVHASRSRGRVVEDTREDYLAGAVRAMHVPWSAIEGAHPRGAGGRRSLGATRDATTVDRRSG